MLYTSDPVYLLLKSTNDASCTSRFGGQSPVAPLGPKATSYITLGELYSSVEALGVAQVIKKFITHKHEFVANADLRKPARWLRTGI